MKEKLEKELGKNATIKGNKLIIDISKELKDFKEDHVADAAVIAIGELPCVKEQINYCQSQIRELKIYHDHYCLEYQRIHGEQYFSNITI